MFCSVELWKEMRERGLSVLLAKIICKFPSGLRTNLCKVFLYLQLFMIAVWLKEVMRELKSP